MLKKGQSISINTIIVAAIALAVLVVLFIIFTGRFKIFSEGVSGAASCAKTCEIAGKIRVSIETKEGCVGGGYNYMPGEYGDVPKNNVCCCT